MNCCTYEYCVVQSKADIDITIQSSVIYGTFLIMAKYYVNYNR